jgi:tryptophanyl-tRNA synthetase
MSTTPALQRSAELEEIIGRDATGFRILTGDRPTGPLHLGHYFGTLRNRVRLQDLGAEVFVLIADYQVLTDRDTAERLDEHVTGLLLDYLAIGLDPARTVVFAHSAVPALNQLLLPFLSLVSVPELSRNPTVKDEIAHSRQSAVSGLMLTYPVHQAADILFCKANLVPVGQDQLPHLEITRVIARRFNDRFGTPVFPVPDALLSAAPLLLGTDGTKMSKSRGNSIPLAAAPTRPPGSSAARRPIPRPTSATTRSSGPRSRAWCCWPPCAWAAARRTWSPTWEPAAPRRSRTR